MGVIAKGIPRGCQGLFAPVSLGYPLSVFNKNSTLKERKSLGEYTGGLLLESRCRDSQNIDSVPQVLYLHASLFVSTSTTPRLWGGYGQ